MTGTVPAGPDLRGPLERLGAASLDALFREVAEASAVVIAVSGGPDSMALMRLAAGWGAQADSGRPRLYVATVDHGLRPESAMEAAVVAAAAADLGLPHVTLRWVGPKPTSRIQERARAARYDLLVDHARAVGAAHVLTAHHADDQAETVLMRLRRGSGVTGLAGMRRQSRLADGVTLVRPLLDVPKASLVAICQEGGARVVDDPSNDDPAFERVRLRLEADAFAAFGLGTGTLLRLAERMRRADDALNDASRRLEERLAPTLAPGLWSGSLAPVAETAPDLLQRIFRRAIAHVVGADDRADRPYPARLERLETLVDDLLAALSAHAAFRATLAGAQIVMRSDGSIRIVPEAPRRRGRPRAEDEAPAPGIVKGEASPRPRSLGK